jgi:hypothetical protein
LEEVGRHVDWKKERKKGRKKERKKERKAGSNRKTRRLG